MTISKVSTFAIDPVRKNSSVDCDCEMVSAEAMVPALCAAEDDDQKRIDDVELTSARPGRADHGESAAGDTGNAASEPESEPVDPPRIDADGAGHGAIRRDAAHLQSPARAEQQQRDAGCDQQRQAHDEQAIDLHFDRVCHCSEPIIQGGNSTPTSRAPKPERKACCMIMPSQKRRPAQRMPTAPASDRASMPSRSYATAPSICPA